MSNLKSLSSILTETNIEVLMPEQSILVLGGRCSRRGSKKQSNSNSCKGKVKSQSRNFRKKGMCTPPPPPPPPPVVIVADEI